MVIGLGGVGSHAASMLLRSGVGKLLLVDFDQVFTRSHSPFIIQRIYILFVSSSNYHTFLCIQVSLSSLNRHAVATREDVGIPKATCLKNHFSSIFPECCVEAKVMLYDSSSEEEILSGNPDFVLDCIDNIDTKVSQPSFSSRSLVDPFRSFHTDDSYDCLVSNNQCLGGTFGCVR